MVGKTEKSKAVRTYIDIMSMMKDKLMFNPIKASTKAVGRGRIMSPTTMTSRATMDRSLCLVTMPTVDLAMANAFMLCSRFCLIEPGLPPRWTGSPQDVRRDR